MFGRSQKAHEQIETERNLSNWFHSREEIIFNNNKQTLIRSCRSSIERFDPRDHLHHCRGQWSVHQVANQPRVVTGMLSGSCWLVWPVDGACSSDKLAERVAGLASLSCWAGKREENIVANQLVVYTSELNKHSWTSECLSLVWLLLWTGSLAWRSNQSLSPSLGRETLSWLL